MKKTLTKLRKAWNSTLPAPTKPIARKTAPKKRGARAIRNAPGDRSCRSAVNRRDRGQCQTCRIMRIDTPEGASLDWSHIHGRNTYMGVPLRQHPLGSLMQCRAHHLRVGADIDLDCGRTAPIQSQTVKGARFFRWLSTDGKKETQPWRRLLALETLEGDA